MVWTYSELAATEISRLDAKHKTDGIHQVALACNEVEKIEPD